MRPTLTRLPTWLLPAAGALAVLLAPQLGVGLNAQRQIVLIAILALLVSGLNLSLGYAGELALGGVAVYAAGAYVSGYLGAHGHTDILLQLAVSGAIALVLGVVTGAPGLRLGHWSLAMTSFFLILFIPDMLALFPDQTGGRVGLTGIGLPTLFGYELGQQGFYCVVVIVGICWFAFMRNLVVSRHGGALRVLRQSPVLAASSGISVFRLKLVAYALGAVPAGFAGTLFANLDHYVPPGMFGFALVVTILAASILGGSMSVYGAVVGAVIMQLGPLQTTNIDNYALVIYGAFLIIGGVLLAEGLSGIVRRLLRRARVRLFPQPEPPSAVTAVEHRATPPTRGAPLEIVNVSKRFSGLQALSDVSLSARPGEVTALIGPNGSGKTTLLNIVNGFYRADTGATTLGGSDLPPHKAHLVARSGVVRTFQTPIVPTGMSVLETVATGRYRAPYTPIASTIVRSPSYRRVRRLDREEAIRALELVGLAHLAGDDADSLPLGPRRLLEVARALVARPAVLLLDEAASGLDEHEVAALARIIDRIRASGATIVLVEHNFQLVLSLADQLYVLAQGRLIASGPPADIENDPDVLAEYLGMAVHDSSDETVSS